MKMVIYFLAIILTIFLIYPEVVGTSVGKFSRAYWMAANR